MFSDTYNEMLNDMIDSLKREDVQKLFDLVEETRSSGKHLFVLGNGGGAAAVSHWVYNFGKRIDRRDSKRLKIFSLTDNGVIFSTLGNDCGYEAMFVGQMKNLLGPGDLVLIFPISGGPSDLMEAHRYAKEIDTETTCVVMGKGSKIIDMSDLAMIIPSEDYGAIEDIHIILGHAILQQIYAGNVGT